MAWRKNGYLLKELKKNGLYETETPVICSMILVYIATVFFQVTTYSNLFLLALFGITMLLHIFLYMCRVQIFKENLFVYFIVQGIIIYGISIILKDSYQIAYLGLIPIMITQSITLFETKREIIYTTIYFYFIYFSPIVLNRSFDKLLNSLSLLILISLSIVIYGYFYRRQVEEHEKTKNLLNELEDAYIKLEEMTRENERQKLARDIHDTLTQGLVGVLMKLEAMNANFVNGNIERGLIISENAIEQLRDNLKESRIIIQELRMQHIRFECINDMIANEVEWFLAYSNIKLECRINGTLKTDFELAKNVSLMVREVLVNILKHSKASEVTIDAEINSKCIKFSIKDNGIGFDSSDIACKGNHYGLVGLNERANEVGGELQIISSVKKGTKVIFKIPVKLIKDGM